MPAQIDEGEQAICGKKDNKIFSAIPVNYLSGASDMLSQ